MTGRNRAALLEDLRARVAGIGWAASRLGRIAPLPFGIAAIDAALPGGGLARGALHEAAGAGPDLRHGAARMTALFRSADLLLIRPHQVAALGRPRTEARHRRSEPCSRGVAARGPLQKPARNAPEHRSGRRVASA